MAQVCRSCKAPVFWAQTRHGLPMPLDVEPVPSGNVRVVEREPGQLPLALVLSGVALAELRAKPDPPPLFVSHFATCPHAAEHRRSGVPPAAAPGEHPGPRPARSESARGPAPSFGPRVPGRQEQP